MSKNTIPYLTTSRTIKLTAGYQQAKKGDSLLVAVFSAAWLSIMELASAVKGEARLQGRRSAELNRDLGYLAYTERLCVNNQRKGLKPEVRA